MKFGENLRNLRIQRGLTQIELARYLETSQAAITAWEHNKREPDFKSIQKIAQFFNTPISVLMDTKEENSPYIDIISESIAQNQKLTQLFSLCRFLSDKELDVIISVVSAMSKGVRHNELP
jgi:transcriptional regulator with XRE-family HTH domain